PLLETITGLIWKEENILFPMCLENLTDDEWMSIREQSDEIGYCLFKPTSHWSPSLEKDEERPVSPTIPEGRIQLPSGSLSLKELELLFNHLPLDITFVDEDDTVIYFSEGERIFLRPRAAIGRKVQFCHPPSSLHIVNQILLDFKNGTRDVAEFWINFQEKFVHIRYFAVRDEKKRYIGTLEMTQDLTRIKALEGEKRL
ncbi:MAG: PAS domain-containing protein, partial [Candidatus Hodarchaeales archaeon]